MNNTWPNRLIDETRNVLDLGFVPPDDFVHMKNINGDFGKISLQNWLDRKLIIKNKETDAEYFYITVDELIADGWAVD
ncbi:MAG: hypothetical protein ACXVA0_24850 [Mucilaginibacter sp.]